MAERNYRQIRTAKPEDVKGTIWKLVKYMGMYKTSLVIVVFGVIISALTNVASSYFFEPIINDYIVPYIGEKNVDLTRFALMLGFMGLIYLTGALSSYIYRKHMMKVSTGVLSRLRNDLFRKLQDMPMQFYDTRTNGQIMTFFTSDVDTMRQLVADTFPQVINTVVQMVGIIVMMFVLDWRLALVTLGMLAVIMYTTYFLSTHGRQYFKDLQKNLSNLNGYIEEIFSGQKVVKAFLHEDVTKEEFREIINELKKSDVKTGTYGSIMMPINANLAYFTYALIACIGAYFCINGTQTIGVIAAFLLYARQISGPISRLSQTFNYVMMALAGAERVFTLIESDPEVDEGDITLVFAEEQEDGSLKEVDHRTDIWAWKDPENGNALTRVRGDVRFKDVQFSYVEGKVVLDDISFYAKPGQKIAFVGSTGAGKTTITNLITRFYDIQSGSITYDGFDIKRIAKSSLRASIGMVLQETNLFSGTVMDNIRYGRLDATDEECIAAAKLANADSFITRLPHGYQTMLTANGTNLSQGQRQLLNIARTAVASPPVLVLDEATSSIDTRTEKIIEQGMDQIMQGRTVFTIAHRLSTVMRSNAIMVIEHGHIIERGTHQELIDQKGRYYQLYTGTLELE